MRCFNSGEAEGTLICPENLGSPDIGPAKEYLSDQINTLVQSINSRVEFHKTKPEQKYISYPNPNGNCQNSARTMKRISDEWQKLGLRKFRLSEFSYPGFWPGIFFSRSFLLIRNNPKIISRLLQVLISARFACSRYASCCSLYICTRAFIPRYGRKLLLIIESWENAS